MKTQRFNEDKQTKKLDELLDELTDEVLEVLYLYLERDLENRKKMHILSIIRALCDVIRQAISHIYHRNLRAGLFTELVQLLTDATTNYRLDFAFLHTYLTSLQHFNAQDLVKLRPHKPIVIAVREHFLHMHDQAPENKRKPKQTKINSNIDKD